MQQRCESSGLSSDHLIALAMEHTWGWTRAFTTCSSQIRLILIVVANICIVWVAIRRRQQLLLRCRGQASRRHGHFLIGEKPYEQQERLTKPLICWKRREDDCHTACGR